MSIVNFNGSLIAVYSQENPELFLGYYLHAVLVSGDAGYHFTAPDLIPREGTEENPHIINIEYTINQEINIKGLRSYAVDTIDISSFGIPAPVSGTVEPECFFKVNLKEGSVTKAESISRTGNIITLSKGEDDKPQD
ncbi:MAG: hypothetical protein AAFP89_16785 [Bacteroidota bacterium]